MTAQCKKRCSIKLKISIFLIKYKGTSIHFTRNGNAVSCARVYSLYWTRTSGEKHDERTYARIVGLILQQQPYLKQIQWWNIFNIIIRHNPNPFDRSCLFVFFYVNKFCPLRFFSYPKDRLSYALELLSQSFVFWVTSDSRYTFVSIQNYQRMSSSLVLLTFLTDRIAILRSIKEHGYIFFFYIYDVGYSETFQKIRVTVGLSGFLSIQPSNNRMLMRSNK